MSVPPQTADFESRPRPRRKGVVILSVTAFALLAGLAGLYLYMDNDAAWTEAVAEAERDDPNWRFMDIVDNRRRFANDANGALAVIAARALIAGNWPSEGLTTALNELPPNRTLNEFQLKQLQEELAKVNAAIAPARKVAEFSDGRHPIRYKPDLWSTLLPTVQETRAVSRLLHHDVIARLEMKDFEGSLLSCRAMLNTARSLGDEPLTIAHLVRTGVRADVLHALERVLAQGEPAEASLKQFQELLEIEQAHPLLLISARGERGALPNILHGVQSGETKIEQILAMSGGGKPGILQTYTYRAAPGKLRAEFGDLLRLLNRWVQAARLPEHEQRAAIQQLEEQARDLPPLARSFVPAVLKISEAFARSQAEMRCAVAGLAAERYRVKHGVWPESRAVLVPEFLPAMPLDPFDARPLRIVRTGEGLVIYSIGPDGEDHGGKLQRDFAGFKRVPADGVDVGFLLWDIEKRRQPPMGQESGIRSQE